MAVACGVVKNTKVISDGISLGTSTMGKLFSEKYKKKTCL